MLMHVSIFNTFQMPNLRQSKGPLRGGARAFGAKLGMTRD
jgi:hypothetical protein